MIKNLDLEHFKNLVKLDFIKIMPALMINFDNKNSNVYKLIDILANIKFKNYQKIYYFYEQTKTISPSDTYLLSKLETIYGIPDDIFLIADTIQERVRNLRLKHKISLGIWSEDDYRSLLSEFGITQVEFKNGNESVNDGQFPLQFPFVFTASGADAYYNWYVYLPQSLITNSNQFPFVFASTQFTSSQNINLIEKLLTKLKPAYMNLIIKYEL